MHGNRPHSRGPYYRPPRFSRGRGRGGYNRDPSSSRQDETSPVRRMYPIGIKVLESLMDREGYIIPMELLKPNSGYDILLEETPIKDYKLKLVISLLEKAMCSKAYTDGSANLALQTFKSSNFCQYLSTFISEMKYDAARADEFLPKIGSIFSNFVRISPLNAYSLISNIVDICFSIILRLKNENSPNAASYEQIFENILTQLKESRLKITTSKKSGKVKYVNPPDNFRDHEVIPTCSELNALERPFIRPNIIEGSYVDQNHYLDVQFRLLKEDFVRPLREGLQLYVSGYNDNARTRNTDVRVYSDVKLEKTGIEGSELIYFIKLKFRKNFRIENSRRLMFGNILCISENNFETMVLASVASRDKLGEHLLGVKIETEPYKLEFNTVFTVIESKAYFVSYKHTLSALQKLDDVPLKDYVVFVEKNVDPPDYLERFTTYEIRDLRNIPQQVCVLNTIRHWPSPQQLSLDDSQLRALHGALTRKMAIIQGPPGTGKTFLGLKITEILLNNKINWKRGKERPILVVCYTNHALDQFLEGISAFTTSIIRVGSQSKNEALREYQISKWIFKHDRSRDDDLVSKSYHSKRMDLKLVKNSIHCFSKLIENLSIPAIISASSIFRHIGIKREILEKLDSLGMENFLLRNFLYDDLDLGEELTLDIQGPDQVPNNDEHDIDEDILKEEEFDRRIDDDDDNADDYELYKGFPQEIYPNFEITFDVTADAIRAQIEDLQKEISSEPFSSKNRNLNKQIDVLNYELRALYASQRLTVPSEREYNLIMAKPLDQMSFIERWKVYKCLVEKLRSHFQNELFNLEKMHMQDVRDLGELKSLQYMNVMKEVQIIGMTTTGAAQYCNILCDLAPPIVIVEEAAEIMESHIISSLSPRCKHLIMIGDHQQLRPKPNVYELETKYNLDTSLFERMILNGIPYETLEYQHRMKPIISSLLVPTIYQNLKNHPSVFRYPKIKGVAKDLFFLNHTQLENPPYEDAESFENLYEARFMMGLCRHLIFQGYNSSDITIITPYSGQLRCFKSLQRSPEFDSCKEVRVSILDNYQGEESNIILLSLVRSNEERKVGFVKIDNRVCVALSRAKHAMYIIGNMSHIAESSSLWKQINDKLISNENIGTEMELVCQNHSDEGMYVKSYDDIIQKSPEGGCCKPCDAILEKCGHSCPRLCHVIDMDHKNINCTIPCPKIICNRGHKCPKLCFQDCPPCPKPMMVQLPCSHTKTIKCSEKIEDVKCYELVEKVLPGCKHTLILNCYVDEAKCDCTFPCTTRLDCGHQCKLKCHALKDPDHLDYDCPLACEKSPENCRRNHKCKKRCFEDCGECETKITLNLKCGHTMKNVLCSVDEESLMCKYPCTKTLDCLHECQKYCGQTCGGCMTDVTKRIPECGHDSKVPCRELPSLKYCSGSCVKRLSCGHPCKKKCKEPCSVKCTELVQTSSCCPRGHSLKMECFASKSLTSFSSNFSELNSKTLGEYCKACCGMKLSCDHLCKGSCGNCLNGRLHETCQEKCDKVLVCGHACKEPCSLDCPPCQEKCLWKCSHSECKRPCGVPCINCKEPCKRKCKHSKCTKKCGEICNREPCNEPCDKFLICKHRCIGFCGEPCPQLCRKCDHGMLTEIFFGTEDEEDARFIVLEDCGHWFESSGLNEWMKLTPNISDGPSEIGMKKCPKCSTAIYNTKRYQTEILTAFEKVKKVKSKHFTLSNKIKVHRNQLLALMKDIRYYWKHEVDILRSNLSYNVNFQLHRKQKQISDLQYEMYTFQLKFLTSAKSVNEKLKEETRPVPPLRRNPLNNAVNERLKRLVEKLMSYKIGISRQTTDEFSCELRRLEICKSIETARKLKSANITSNQYFNKIQILMDPTIKFDKNCEEKVVLNLKEMEKYLGSLRISNKERLQIVQAMGLKQGHWYSCPNGHIYCIADCGGAVEESTCPECKAIIGGTSHRLRSDNRVATEMDGATRSAWPGGI